MWNSVRFCLPINLAHTSIRYQLNRFSISRYMTMIQVDRDLYYKAMINGVHMFKGIRLYKKTSYDSPVVYYAL